MKSIQKILVLQLVIVGLIFLNTKSFAHCEVPCGIYDDSVRVALIYEHITTIEKAMNNIKELSKEASPNYNQLIRWVMNKESHAEKLQNIVSQYFLHQRIKVTDTSEEEAYEKYVKSLTLLHEMLVYAMKTKQTTDQEFIDKLRTTLHTFEEVYFHGHSH
jgi:nickel superoxide dismutase